MKYLTLIAAVLLVVVGSTLIFQPNLGNTKIVDPETAVPAKSVAQKGTLSSFRSQKELKDFLKGLFVEQRSRMKNKPSASANTAAESKSDASASKDSVTNVQHAGVDEGGIVKLHGNHLVVLRRGRLFTVAVGDDSLRPISSINAFGPDINPRGTWYDEMLISKDTIAVIGYSYSRGGTEIGIFNITNSGGLSYRSTHHLRSNDYYSSQNYASRLIGNKLIFYSPLYIGFNSTDPLSGFPALRKWKKGATNKDFKSISSPERVYKPVHKLNGSYYAALHTVTVCNLDNSEFRCEATSVIGPAGRVFYVSPKSVYVWATDWKRRNGRAQNRSTLYQLPLNGSAPTAVGVSGSPVDQFSFLESEDNHLNVLVRSNGNGEAMWNSEVTAGDVALLRIPRRKFGDGRRNISARRYRALPKPIGYSFQNRFVGKHLLYGTGANRYSNTRGERSNLYAVNWKSGRTDILPLEHGVQRIERMGNDAVVVGTKGSDLYFSPVKLKKTPVVKPSFMRKNARQGEDRSHGFFYKPKNRNTGMLGLPIIGNSNRGSYDFNRGSASILFLRNNSLELNEMGTLKARAGKQGNDRCQASCVDWYGNARPLFIKGRVFALLGYEIVEGIVTDGGIKERRRRSFSPAS